jgi:hypothetical protein
MSMFQTLMAIVVLIFVLSVMVQGLQEVVKSLLDVKAKTMTETVDKFMGDNLPTPQVQGALQTRGLGISALEHFNKDDFRHLLDGIDFSGKKLDGIICDGAATLDQKKENMAASFDAARASFQKAYTAKNKRYVLLLSLVVVLVLNANLLMLYEELSAGQIIAPAIINHASSLMAMSPSGNPPSGSLAESYQKTQQTIGDAVAKFPPLVRFSVYPEDLRERPIRAILGLILMALLVSLGAPFWNDVLKGMMGVNNVLNSGARQ